MIQPRTVAFMDFGTNSIRLLVVRFESSQSHTILHRIKETVRLGEGEFARQVLQPEAIERATQVAVRFAHIAAAAGADETIAVATAATREAENRNDFLHRVHHEAGIDLRIVSGLEEARLIYLGVASGVHLDKKQAFFIDIGGGSTETAIGNQNNHLYLNSLKLGAIRLSNQFLTGMDGPVSPNSYQRIRGFVRNHAARTLHELGGFQIDFGVGSSGTIENLADVCIRLSRKRSRIADDALTYLELREGIKLLCSLPLEERRKAPGLNPTRADIIIGGAAIIDTFMEDLGVQELRISERGLSDGLLIDYMLREGHADVVNGVPLRERSILHLGRTCRFNEEHARMTARFALRLFDSAKTIGLHHLGNWERGLLEYAALLHHIGSFLTYTGYQKHGYYLVRNAELLGFNELETTLMALTVLYHRGSLPRKSDPDLTALSREERRTIDVLSTLLRLAENLDRSQATNVQDARLIRGQGTRVMLELRALRDCHVEVAGLEDQRDDFEKIFGRRLEIRATVDERARTLSAK